MLTPLFVPGVRMIAGPLPVDAAIVMPLAFAVIVATLETELAPVVRSMLMMELLDAPLSGLIVNVTLPLLPLDT